MKGKKGRKIRAKNQEEQDWKATGKSSLNFLDKIWKTAENSSDGDEHERCKRPARFTNLFHGKTLNLFSA